MLKEHHRFFRSVLIASDLGLIVAGGIAACALRIVPDMNPKYLPINMSASELDGQTSLCKRLQYDLFYIRHWSLMLDIRILWMPLFRGFLHPQAN